jgi:peptidoglycan-associated lipoprotein
MRQLPIVAAGFSLFLAAACAHKPAVPESQMVKEAPRATGPQEAKAPPEQSCNRDEDCSASALCIRNHCVAITPEVELAECGLVRVHFDYDASNLRDEDRPRLDRSARCLRADQKLHVTIEGNADERGTEEYNLLLGSKRALQVERYLQALGASKDQLKTISYGYEKPLCGDHNEPCWAQNRRAAVKAQASSH